VSTYPVRTRRKPGREIKNINNGQESLSATTQANFSDYRVHQRTKKKQAGRRPPVSRKRGLTSNDGIRAKSNGHEKRRSDHNDIEFGHNDIFQKKS